MMNQVAKLRGIYKMKLHNGNLTDDELQTVINLVDARLDRQYNEEYQNILDKLTELQWRQYGS